VLLEQAVHVAAQEILRAMTKPVVSTFMASSNCLVFRSGQDCQHKVVINIRSRAHPPHAGNIRSQAEMRQLLSPSHVGEDLVH
jgi:hypothetical protein